MTTKFGDLLFIDTPHRPEPGSFCKAKDLVGNRYKTGQWHYCREVFHTQLYNLPLFFFSHKPFKGHCIAAFLKKVEDMLDVKPRSRFGPTQRKTIMWIEPSKWWTIRAMRRSFFTIMLRVGKDYLQDKDNFALALYSDIYTAKTSYAVERFLKGHTIYTGKKRGWYNQFADPLLSHTEIDKLLVKP